MRSSCVCSAALLLFFMLVILLPAGSSSPSTFFVEAWLFASSHNTNTVFKCETNGTDCYDLLDGQPSTGGLDKPHGILHRGMGTEDDHLLVASWSGKILKYNASSGAFLGDFSNSTLINNPVYMIEKDMMIYISSQGNDNILTVDSENGGNASVFASTASHGCSGPSGMAWHSDGRLYVACRGTGRVVAFAANGSFVGTVDTASGANSYVFGLQFSSDGNELFYVAAGSVRRVSVPSYSFLGASSAGGNFDAIGLERSSAGSIFLATGSQNGIKELNANGSTVGNSIITYRSGSSTISFLNFFTMDNASATTPAAPPQSTMAHTMTHVPDHGSVSMTMHENITTAAPAPNQTTAAPTTAPNMTTAAPNTTAAPTPAPNMTTAAPTDAPVQVTVSMSLNQSTLEPTAPNSTTEAPSQNTTIAPTDTPAPPNVTDAPPNSTTEAPTDAPPQQVTVSMSMHENSTTAAPAPNGTTAAPNPAPNMTTAAPNSTTAAPTQAPNMTTPAPNGTTPAPTDAPVQVTVSMSLNQSTLEPTAPTSNTTEAQNTTVAPTDTPVPENTTTTEAATNTTTTTTIMTTTTTTTVGSTTTPPVTPVPPTPEPESTPFTVQLDLDAISTASAPKTEDEFASYIATKLSSGIGSSVTTSQIKVTSYNPQDGTGTFVFIGGGASNLAAQAETLTPASLGVLSFAAATPAPQTPIPAPSTDDGPSAVMIICIIAVAVVIISVVVYVFVSKSDKNFGTGQRPETEDPFAVNANNRPLLQAPSQV